MGKEKQIRVISEYRADELGLPVIMKDVPVIEVDGMEVLDIDYEKISELIFFALIMKPAPFTGLEVRFMRLFMGLTLEKLATSLHVTHPTVIAWEKHGEASAKITDSTEMLLRLFAAQTGAEDSELVSVLLGKYFRGPTKQPVERYAPVVELNVKNREEMPYVRFSNKKRDLQFLQTAK
jgi:DNA-binding transcriptional regulator YiaG